MSNIHVQGLRKAFGKRAESVAVDDVSFDVVPGEMLVLVGPSGCGKTTTLRCIAGLESPDRGLIKFGDRTIFDAQHKVAVPIHRRDIGLVFQNYALWPHLSGWDNIAFPLKARWMNREQRRAKLNAIASVVELDPRLLDKRPGQLSGGQQQRVALARALVAEPAVVLFDEPLSNLDAALREQLRSELRRLHEHIGFTGVYVTHDLTEAMMLGDRVAAMSDGVIVQLGRPDELFENPRTNRIARMMGYRRMCSIESVDGRWVSSDSGFAGPVDGEVRAGKAYDVFARPDRITVRPLGSREFTANEYKISGGTIAGIGYLGGEQELVIEFGSRSLRLVTAQGETFAAGSRVDLAVPAADVRIFEIDSQTGSGPVPEPEGVTNALASN